MPTASRNAWMDAWGNDLVPSNAALRSAARVSARTRSARYYGREATARVAQLEPETSKNEALPELKVVTQRKPRWGAIMVALLFAGLLLGACIVGPMLVSSAATDLETAAGKLEAQRQGLAEAASAMSAQISSLSSPERVTEQAIQLGLEPAQSVHYLQNEAGTASLEGDTTVAGR